MTDATAPETPQNQAIKDNSSQPAPTPPGPASDLRDIQALLVGGIFPGNLAPAVIKAYNLLEKMARALEEEFKAKAGDAVKAEVGKVEEALNVSNSQK